jgi:ribonuclease Z
MCLFSQHKNFTTQTITVILFGTNDPKPPFESFGAATIVEAGGNFFCLIVDGELTQLLWQQKIGVGKVNRLFLTHLHSNPIAGIPGLWVACKSIVKGLRFS